MKKILLVPIIACIDLLNGDGLVYDCANEMCTETSYALEMVFDRVGAGGPATSSGNRYTPFLTNNNGEIIWCDPTDDPNKTSVYYWSRKQGIVPVDIRNHLSLHGFEPTRGQNSRWYYDHRPIFLDDSGDLFLMIDKQTNKGWNGSRVERRVGVWNKNYGFKLLNIPEINDVREFYITPEYILVDGLDGSFHQNMLILKRPKSFWPDEPSEKLLISEIFASITPWDKLPMGVKGARLYALEKLISCKSAKKNRQVIDRVIEAEAVHLLDVLKADAKKAETLIEQASIDGKENADAEKDYHIALKTMEALKQYLSRLKIRSNIFSLDLPSDSWDPTVE